MNNPGMPHHSVEMLPMDSFNQELVKNVHPPHWKNPDPSGRYNLVIIGAGTAGLVTAAVSAGLGAKVALIERYLMGGDCLNVGCVPSKGIIRASRTWSEFKRAEEFGLTMVGTAKQDFGMAMARMRQLRAQLSRTDSASRFQQLGVDVYMGHGSFTGPQTLTVDGKTLSFTKAVICTGARAIMLPIPGLQETGCLTNESAFSLTELPVRLAVIGAGPIGCELAQAFARFGSQVVVFEQECRILPREDREAAEIVKQSMSRDGVQFICDANITEISRRDGHKIIHYAVAGNSLDIAVDEILVGIGRAPNVENLGLEKVGVAYDSRRGVTVNNRLQTTNAKIYAAGDICFPLKFTHTADAMAKIVIQNALFPHPLGLGYASTDSLIIPWCTYTDPEIAHVGLYEEEAKTKGVEIDTFVVDMKDVDRAVLDGEDKGFAKVHVKQGTDQLVGATIVSAHAGDLISELTLAIKTGTGLRAIADTIYPYPTQAEVLKKVANAWRKTTFTERKQYVLSKWFTWSK